MSEPEECYVPTLENPVSLGSPVAIASAAAVMAVVIGVVADYYHANDFAQTKRRGLTPEVGRAFGECRDIAIAEDSDLETVSPWPVDEGLVTCMSEKGVEGSLATSERIFCSGMSFYQGAREINFGKCFVQPEGLSSVQTTLSSEDGDAFRVCRFDVLNYSKDPDRRYLNPWSVDEDFLACMRGMGVEAVKLKDEISCAGMGIDTINYDGECSAWAKASRHMYSAALLRWAGLLD